MRTLVTVGGERDYPGHVPSGPIGRRLVDRLLAAGRSVRVLTPASQADGWPDGAEVIAGDVADPEQFSDAFDDIDRMWLAGATPETVRQAVTLARHGGVQRIVLLSSHGPEVELEFPPDSWYWLAIEVVVERSGAQWTHVQPSPIMAQAVQPGFPDVGSDLGAAIRSGETVREADLDASYPLVDEADLAEVAMAALFQDEYVNQTLEVHGEPVSVREQLELAGRALDRTIPVAQLTPEEAAERLRRHGGSEAEIAEQLAAAEPATDEPDLEYRQWVTAGVEALTHVLGRPPRTYADWLADHLDELR